MQRMDSLAPSNTSIDTSHQIQHQQQRKKNIYFFHGNLYLSRASTWAIEALNSVIIFAPDDRRASSKPIWIRFCATGLLSSRTRSAYCGAELRITPRLRNVQPSKHSKYTRHLSLSVDSQKISFLSWFRPSLSFSLAHPLSLLSVQYRPQRTRECA